MSVIKNSGIDRWTFVMWTIPDAAEFLQERMQIKIHTISGSQEDVTKLLKEMKKENKEKEQNTCEFIALPGIWKTKHAELAAYAVEFDYIRKTHRYTEKEIKSSWTEKEFRDGVRTETGNISLFMENYVNFRKSIDHFFI